jgi:hypothetical protein
LRTSSPTTVSAEAPGIYPESTLLQLQSALPDQASEDN